AASMTAFARVRTSPEPWACAPAWIHHRGATVAFPAPPPRCSMPNDSRIRMPAATGTDQALCSQRRRAFTGCVLLRASLLIGSDGRRCRPVAGLRDGGDEVVDRRLRLVVIDFDTARREVHLHVLDAFQAADLLLDL